MEMKCVSYYCSFTIRLYLAIEFDIITLAKSMLESGANPNYCDHLHTTPVHRAVTRGEKPGVLLRILIKYGGNIFAKDLLGQNVLHYLTREAPVTAVPHDAYLALALIWMGVPLNVRCSSGFQPIHLAASRGNDNLLKLYLDMGANVNALADDGLTPLHMAARNQVPSTMLLVLLKRGAKINQRTTDARTPLHEACINFRENNIRILLSVGADLLAEDRDGKTPFALYIDRYIRYGTESQNLWLMIKVLALMSNELIKDESLLKSSPKIWDYYQDCRVHVARMKLTRFANNCTFYELLTKSRNEIAEIMMGDSNFEANFSLYDLSKFCMYEINILGSFERAQPRCRFLIEQEDLINEAFYRTLPDVVARKVARCSWNFFEKNEICFFKC